MQWVSLQAGALIEHGTDGVPMTEVARLSVGGGRAR
jgi:hypothetical protein